ncbi:MAG: hypothetical protein JXB45_08935, partial [Candidatus Krumholzibacteriota bacterium]|nr:hypothetical protein [Candidatus Krumholzibacteriota bacterium]
YPRLPESRVLEMELDCRPCSRNGALPCPLGTRECLERIQPDQVITAIEAIFRERAERALNIGKSS